MDLGATKGELALVIFVFALVYMSGLLPKLGARLGAFIASRRKGG